MLAKARVRLVYASLGFAMATKAASQGSKPRLQAKVLGLCCAGAIL